MVLVAAERLEDGQQPCGDVVRRVALAQLQERPGAAAVFRWRGAPATDAARIGLARLKPQDLLDPEVVLPEVGEVVLIPEALADAEPERRHPHATRVDAAIVPVLAPLDDEAMQVLIAPAEGRLQDGM